MCNKAQQTPLLVACHSLDLRMVQLLIANGANPRHIGQGGNSALSMCMANFVGYPIQTTALIQYLLEETAYLGDGRIENKHISLLQRLIRNIDHLPAAVEAFIPI